MSFKAFSSRRSSLTQTFVESCVDFEGTNWSVLMVRRLEIPTLSHPVHNECLMSNPVELHNLEAEGSAGTECSKLQL